MGTHELGNAMFRDYDGYVMYPREGEQRPDGPGVHGAEPQQPEQRQQPEPEHER